MPEPERIGKYEILQEAGRGGFAVVYKAQDTTLDRLVALKMLHPLLSSDPEFAQRFRREAQTVARLRHPHIVVLYETGQEEDRLYMAMEYLPGRTLAQVLAERQTLPLEQSLVLLEQLAGRREGRR